MLMVRGIGVEAASCPPSYQESWPACSMNDCQKYRMESTAGLPFRHHPNGTHPPQAVPPIAFAMKVSHWIFARYAHYKSSSLTFPL